MKYKEMLIKYTRIAVDIELGNKTLGEISMFETMFKIFSSKEDAKRENKLYAADFQYIKECVEKGKKKLLEQLIDDPVLDLQAELDMMKATDKIEKEIEMELRG